MRQCASCKYKIRNDQLVCPNCGFVFPRYTGDKDSYENMLAEIGEEYREANNISIWKEPVKNEKKADPSKLSSQDELKITVNEQENAAVERVRKLIDEIRCVSIYSGDKIVAARQAYDALNAKEKTELCKSEECVLVKAESDYKTLKVNLLESTCVERIIKEIGSVTLDSKTKIELARAAYDALTPEAKKYVTIQNFQLLKNAEMSYDALVREKETRIKDVISRINNLNDVIEPSKETILAARKAFDNLTEEEKCDIPLTTRQILFNAENKQKQAEINMKFDINAAKRVENEINNIGSVSLTNKSKVLSARMSYNALSSTQKKWISLSTENILKNAENMLKQLEDKENREKDVKNGFPKPPQKESFTSEKKFAMGVISIAVVAIGISLGMIAGHYFGPDTPNPSEIQDSVVQTSSAIETNTSTLIIEDSTYEIESIVSEPSDSETNIIEPQDLLTSQRIQEYNGQKYTTYDISKEGWVCVSGDYVDTLLVYDNHIYWRKTTELGHFQCDIIRMNLDCTNQTVLTRYADSYKPFHIYDGFLYYTHLGENGNADSRSSRRIDLKTLAEDINLPYYIVMGSESVWFSSDLAQSALYSSLPGHQEMIETSGVEGTKLGVIGNQLFYIKASDNGYITKAYNGKTGEVKTFLDYKESKSALADESLYYKHVDNGYTTLYRLDVKTNNLRSYDLGYFNLYMGGGFFEIGNNVYFIQFRPENGNDNTEFWEMDLNTGERSMIATWYNSNAENASKEP